MSSETDEIAREQQYVTMLYDRLDALRERTSSRFADVLREAGGTPQQRTERDAFAAEHADRLAQLDAAENGLCFGRLDSVGDGGNAGGENRGERSYIGRLGILDEHSDYEPLLLDWRAPAARPFYIATAAAPLGVRRRRHIKTRLRKVTGLDDDALDLNLNGDGNADSADLVGEGALLAAVTAHRTGRMRDVVETIQAEQDHAIRADLAGVLVVQGGPGTGKTAVALHRAAYLLYTHRERLARRGVLIVGPNTTFMRYISHVLPALGETGAVLRTLGELYPGVTAQRAESTAVAEIKGRPIMAQVVAAAVRAQQRVPDDTLKVVIDNYIYRLDRNTCIEARDKARSLHEPHNLARPAVVEHILDALADQAMRRLNEDPFAEASRELIEQISRDLQEIGDPDDRPLEEELLDRHDRNEVRRTLAEEPAVHEALDWLWPELTPQQLLTELYASPDLLEEAAPQLTDAERALLRREPGGGWSVADVPVLDEAAEVLGAPDTEAAEAERQRREALDYAQGVLEVLQGSTPIEREDPYEYEQILTATDLLDAERIADQQEIRRHRTIAERAARDRTWTFGHLIVDEAQELSAMAWRLLMRRCPGRSMTIVGDLAQTGDIAGTSSWGAVLEPYVGKRWRMAELTVNYRTPAEVMAVAAKVLARIDPTLEPPRSVRESGIEPWEETVPKSRFAARLGTIARREALRVGDGRLAVIVPQDAADDLAAAVADALPDAAYGADPDLERQTVVLTVRQAKGLEFDTVIVADPDAVAADPRRGDSDLYVALTRTTNRLGMVKVDNQSAND